MTQAVSQVELPAASGTQQERPTASLRSLALRGSAWTIAGYGASQVLRLGSNLIVTRLLFPEAFGLMALVHVFMQGLQMFSDVGIRPSIIQNKRGDDPDFLNTAWTIQVIRGCVLWICACLLAWPAAWLFAQNDPLAWRLVELLPVAGLTALIAGFSSTGLFTLNRQLAFGRLTALDLVSQIVGICVMIGWALVHRSVWALVAGGLVGGVVRMCLSHRLVPSQRNCFRWDRDSVKALFSFGKWIFVSTVITFIAMQADRVIFGQMIPLEMLGVYSIGLMIATVPSRVLGRLALVVVFPLYSRMHNQGDSLKAVLTRVRVPILLAGGGMLALLVATGPPLVRFLYDDRYAEAGWIIQLLALGGWFVVLEGTNGAALLARGQANWVAACNAAKVLAMVVLLPLGYAQYGFPGAVAGFAAAEFFRYTVSVVAAGRAGLLRWTDDLVVSLNMALTAGGGWFAALYLQMWGAPHGLVVIWAAAAVALLSVPGLTWYCLSPREVVPSNAPLRATGMRMD